MKQLPRDTNMFEVRSHASDYGHVMSIDLWDVKDSKTAVVEYVCEKDVVKALDAFDGRRMQDWYMVLKCSIVD